MRRTGVWLGFSLLAALAAPPTGLAAGPDEAPAPADAGATITMNFEDVELAILVKFISQITGKNFIIDEQVKGKVTVVSPTPVTAEEAYRVLESVLQVKGFTTIPTGPAIKIVPTKEAKAQVPLGPPEIKEGGEFVTRLVPLEFIDASELSRVLRPLVSKDGLVSAYAPTNTLIIIDTATNVQRLRQIIAEMDIEGQERSIEVIPLQHAFAEELAETLREALAEAPRPTAAGRQGRPAPRVKTSAAQIIPEARTNSLVVLASPLNMRLIRRLAAKLDVPLPSGVQRINVYFLKNADAEDLVQVLGDIVGGRTPTQPARAARARTQALRRMQAQARTAATGASPEFTGEVRITADPATNALIISAAPQDYATLRSVIEQLDIRRRQVYVEAIILEVSLDKSRQLGIELQGAMGVGKGAGLGRVNFGGLGALSEAAPLGALSGLLLAAASGQVIQLPDGTEIPAQAALLTALLNESDVNVLSAPNILTTDNQEAEILVGQNVPFIASRATDTTQLTNLFATVSRQDVGITLRLTPQIAEGNVVRLEIFEEVSALVPTTVGDPNLVGPTTTVRSANTTVVAGDGQTVVIGGLISDELTTRERRVPFLGDVPVLGHLFRDSQDTSRKTNLLIFLTPHIIRNEHDLQAVSVGRRDAFREFLRRHGAKQQREGILGQPSFEALPRRQKPEEPAGEPPRGGVLLPAVPGPREAAPPPST